MSVRVLTRGRCLCAVFPTKAITAWREASEPARLWICGAYFHYSVPGGFTPAEGEDISPYPGRSDPLYVVSARKVVDVPQEAAAAAPPGDEREQGKAEL